MSSDKARNAPAIPDHVLPLPAKPNLEFERKRAKHMLRSIVGGDVDALERVRRYRSAIAPADVKLSDVHLTIAREYGFSSWPRLVSFYETLDRHERAGPRFQSYRLDHYEMGMRRIIDSHARRRPYVTRGLAAFVPRFYGRSDEEIFATPITRADAQIVVARMDRFLGWDALVEHASKELPPDRRTIELSELKPTGEEDMETLSVKLLFGIHRKPKDVADLLDRGADPNWLPPDGVPILEHALLNYWNPEAVDLIARRVTPRRALWIAAGLGDVPTMLSFLDRNGRPKPEARANRPDFTLVGFNSPCRPDADDLEIVWEAFCVAGFNQRLNTLDALLDRGFPIDYSQWGSTLLSWAEGNGITSLADHLKKRGA